MKADEVNVDREVHIKDGKLTERFGVLLRTVNALVKRTGGPAFRAFGPLPAYTVAELPDASKYPRCLVYVSDGASDQHLAISDGVNWRFSSGSIVS